MRLTLSKDSAADLILELLKEGVLQPEDRKHNISTSGEIYSVSLVPVNEGLLEMIITDATMRPIKQEEDQGLDALGQGNILGPTDDTEGLIPEEYPSASFSAHDSVEMSQRSASSLLIASHQNSRHKEKRKMASKGKRKGASKAMSEETKKQKKAERRCRTECKKILQRFQSMDESNFFGKPVSELYPDHAEDYKNHIQSPMDFGTIETRLPTYTKVSELEQDLKLVFHNCIVYNGVESDLGKVAKEFLDSMEDVISEVKGHL